MSNENDLSKVKEKINEIEKNLVMGVTSSVGNVYKEMHIEKVSSNLYRDFDVGIYKNLI